MPWFNEFGLLGLRMLSRLMGWRASSLGTAARFISLLVVRVLVRMYFWGFLLLFFFTHLMHRLKIKEIRCKPKQQTVSQPVSPSANFVGV